MKLNRFFFKEKGYHLTGEIDYSSLSFPPYHIKQIKTAKVDITGEDFDDLITLFFKISVDVIGVCGYTLEDVPLHLDIEDSLSITSDPDEDNPDIFYEPKMVFDIDPYVLSIIVSEIPMQIIKEGAELPSGTDSVRVISEAQYEKEEKEKSDPRLSILDDIEL